MKKKGLVIGLDGNLARVAVMRQSGCGGECSSCSSCSEVAPTIVKVGNDANAQIGDQVEIQGSGNILKLTFMIYAIPLVFFIAGLVAGAMIFKDLGYKSYEIISFGIGLLALIVSFIILKLIDKKYFEKNNQLLTITKII